MNISERDKLPLPGEALAEYVRRMRTALGMSQAELAQRAECTCKVLEKLS